MTNETQRLWIPSRKIAFASRPAVPNNYYAVGKQILRRGQEIPTGDYTVSLLHQAFCFDGDSRYKFENVREETINGLWIFNRNLWTSKGVYVVQDPRGIGNRQKLKIRDLEEELKDGKDLADGVRFSRSGRVRFAIAPEGECFECGCVSPKEFAQDRFVIASFGQEGAEKLGEVSSKFKGDGGIYSVSMNFGSNYYLESYGPHVYCMDLKEGEKPVQTVSSISMNGEGEFVFNGTSSSNSNCSAFGILKNIRRKNDNQ